MAAVSLRNDDDQPPTKIEKLLDTRREGDHGKPMDEKTADAMKRLGPRRSGKTHSHLKLAHCDSPHRNAGDGATGATARWPGPEHGWFQG
jgi:hypothetical protein